MSRIEINRAAVRELLTSPSGPVFREVAKICRRTEAGAKRRASARVDTGQGRASISSAVRVEGTRVIGRVGTPMRHMLYQHEGTGLYGPRRRRIVPVHRKFLKFPSGKKGQFVFAKSVAGVKPLPFLTEAFKESCPWPVRPTIA